VTYPRGWNALTEPLKAEAREAVRRATPLGAAAARTTETGVKERADIALLSVRFKSEVKDRWPSRLSFNESPQYLKEIVDVLTLWTSKWRLQYAASRHTPPAPPPKISYNALTMTTPVMC